MKSIVLFSALFFFSTAWAQKITVKKVKGRQAIVQIDDGSLSQGGTYDLVGDEFSSTTSGSKGSAGARNKIIGMSAYFNSLTTKTTSTSSGATNYGGSIRYGWNNRSTEFGFIGSFGSDDTGNGSAMSFGGGGFFDYNFKPNKPGTDMVYGAGIVGTYVITNRPNGGGSSNKMEFFPSGVLKWFMLGNSVALRFDFGYLYSTADSSGNKTTISGLNGVGGLSVYF